MLHTADAIAYSATIKKPAAERCRRRLRARRGRQVPPRRAGELGIRRVTRFAGVLRQIDVAKAQPELEIPSNAQNDHLSSKWSYPTKAHQTADTANALAEPNIFAIPTEIGRVVWVGPNQEVPPPIHEVRPIPTGRQCGEFGQLHAMHRARLDYHGISLFPSP